MKARFFEFDKKEESAILKAERAEEASMAIKSRLFQTLSYEEVADLLARRALEHKGQKPIVAGLYGVPTRAKKEFPSAVDDRIIALRGNRVVHLFGREYHDPLELSYTYRLTKRSVPSCEFPLVLVPYFDEMYFRARCFFVDLIAVKAFGKFPEYIVFIQNPLLREQEPIDEIVASAIAYRMKFAVCLDLPPAQFPLLSPHFFVVTLPRAA